MGDSAPSLLLQPTGKVDAWLRATRTGEDEVLLDVDAGHGEAVRSRLQRFRLRTQVELELAQWSGLALRGPGAFDLPVPEGAVAVPARWPGVDGVDLLSGQELALAGVTLAEASDLEALRVECGVPAMGAELTDATIPAEAGQWLIDASVSFTKGCYTGQELVARIDSRGGNVPRPLRGLRVEADWVTPGAEVGAGDAVVGTVTSVAWSPVLGLVALAPISRATAPGSAVTVAAADGSTVPATVAELPLR